MFHFFSYNDWDIIEAAIYSEWAFAEEQDGQQAVAVGAPLLTATTQADSANNNCDGDDSLDSGSDNDDDNGNGDNSQQQDQICHHCFLAPCVTENIQTWLGEGAGPHVQNSPLRKKRYKLFWTILSNRGAWQHPMLRRSRELYIEMWMRALFGQQGRLCQTVCLVLSRANIPVLQASHTWDTNGGRN